MKFGYATVYGTWDRSPGTGIYTATGEFDDTLPDQEIYQQLKTEAGEGRWQESWGKGSAFDVVTAAAILPGEVNSAKFPRAVMNVISWHISGSGSDKSYTSYGAEAMVDLSGPTCRTAEVFDTAREAATGAWRDQHPGKLAHLAVGSFVLLRG